MGTEILVLKDDEYDFISLTDMLIANDGDFFISDWLRNRNTIEFLGIWEMVYNPKFNYGEFAIIKSQSGLNSYKISVKEWVERTNPIGLRASVDKVAKHEIGDSTYRYACYLVAQNEDSRKKEISFAQ